MFLYELYGGLGARLFQPDPGLSDSGLDIVFIGAMQ